MRLIKCAVLSLIIFIGLCWAIDHNYQSSIMLRIGISRSQRLIVECNKFLNTSLVTLEQFYNKCHPGTPFHGKSSLYLKLFSQYSDGTSLYILKDVHIEEHTQELWVRDFYLTVNREMEIIDYSIHNDKRRH